MSRRRAYAVAISVLCLPACASQAARSLRRASRDLSGVVARGDTAGVRKAAVPGLQARVDAQGLVEPSKRRTWARTLARPVEVRPEALLLLPVAGTMKAEETDEGWRLAEDPSLLYDQRTPRQALRAFVLATRMQRWEIVVGLAPLRYRAGLSAPDVQRAWTQGEHAQVLREARDRVEQGLRRPLYEDADQAQLTISENHRVYLEREGDRWVIADFLPRDAVGK